MTVKGGQFTVGTGATVKLAGDDTFNGVSILLRNRTGTASVWLGGGDLATGATPANAFEWKAADPPLTVELAPGDALMAVVATGGATQTVEALSAKIPSGSD